MRRRRVLVSVFVWAALAPGRALGQDVPPEVQLAPPTARESAPDRSAIDLQNLVTTAAKGTTTVQEAPAIVTVITAEDLARWGYRFLEDALTDVPGWNHYPAEGETVPLVTTRGQTQSMLILHDGISLFDASYNAQTLTRPLPVESIKRVEVVTGPGGVLWGANSFLGIVNIITKDADDVDGVEASAGYGDGRGNASDARAYLLVGQSLAGGRLKLFAHASYETYQGQILESRQVIAHPPAPQPNGEALFGSVGQSDQPRSWLWNLDGKATLGPLSLTWLWTDGAEHWPGTFPLGLVQQQAPEGSPWGPTSQTDPNHLGRDNLLNIYDRFAALEYRDRLASGRLGLDVKAFAVQTIINLAYFMFLPPSTALPGGATFRTDPSSQRAGATFDGDVTLPLGNRLLLGGEVFHEWTDGSIARFPSPDPAMLGTPPGTGNRLPFLCPHDAQGRFLPECPVVFLFPASRDVAAVFVSDQWRPVRTLTLDAGTRAQVGMGELGYDPVVQFSGSLVWNFVPRWHLKANFSQGFRPPIFASTSSNGAAVQIAGNRNIKSEFSNAAQAEINARLLRDVRRVRELTLRADYSYTVLDNLVVINNGSYVNSGRRGIHSAELLARLYLVGEHSFQLGYTFLQVADEIKGALLSTPNHWFTAGAAFRLLPELELVSTLWIGGAAEDPNRLPQPNLGSCLPGPPTPATCGADALTSQVALDRTPALALWNLGLSWRNALVRGLELSAFAYNVLDQHWYYADAFYDLSPQLELQPYPGIGRSFFVKARVRY